MEKDNTLTMVSYGNSVVLVLSCIYFYNQLEKKNEEIRELTNNLKMLHKHVIDMSALTNDKINKFEKKIKNFDQFTEKIEMLSSQISSMNSEKIVEIDYNKKNEDEDLKNLLKVRKT